MHVENNAGTRATSDELGNNNNAATGADDCDDDDEERQRQRSLLQTLWNEATSTTDLPSNDHISRLHHRRAKSAETGNNIEPSSSSSSYSPLGKHKRHPHGVVIGGGGRLRVSRGSKVAKRVWLTAFAACATSFLIALHIFLYRVFVGHNIVINNVAGSGEEAGGSSISIASRGEEKMEKKNGMPILAVEDQEAKMTLNEALTHQLAPITEHSIDTLQYTIRINTWQRNEQLLLSVNHHAKCEGVAQIHVIWCDDSNDPPDDIVHHVSGKVKVEKHVINSLNERFKVLLDTPTLGILSLDDDVLRPCMALDAAFLRWTRHPDRMVGFDARTHVVVGNEDAREDGSSNNNSKWKYGYMSTTESSNRYSITLPRASFIHRDYLDLYIMALPRAIYSYVAQNLECEDVAMSFLVSSLTGGKPPLLADYWAVKSMVKMYSTKKISGGKDHKATRDACVNDFAQLLGLKEDGEWPLQTGKLLHKDKFFGYGTESEEWSNIEVRTISQSSASTTRLQDVVKKMQQLQTLSSNERMSWLTNEKATTMMEAKEAGMIENTPEWTKRWSTHTQ
jgi:glucuronyl/N-acetylglucosaminyl transferase EXT2